MGNSHTKPKNVSLSGTHQIRKDTSATARLKEKLAFRKMLLFGSHTPILGHFQLGVLERGSPVLWKIQWWKILWCLQRVQRLNCHYQLLMVRSRKIQYVMCILKSLKST